MSGKRKDTDWSLLLLDVMKYLLMIFIMEMYFRNNALWSDVLGVIMGLIIISLILTNMNPIRYKIREEKRYYD